MKAGCLAHLETECFSAHQTHSCGTAPDSACIARATGVPLLSYAQHRPVLDTGTLIALSMKF
jgi:hypothetical protein